MICSYGGRPPRRTAMDNRINENRKKIRRLRTQMLEAEAAIRGQIGRDEDCSESSIALMAMRMEMSELSKKRAVRGAAREQILIERLMRPRRPAARPMTPEVKRELARKRA